MLQDNFMEKTKGFLVGQIIKPKEPNDLEAINCGEDNIGIGLFVVKTHNSNNIEVIKLPTKTSTLDDIFGVTINDVTTAYSTTNSFKYKKHDTALVGRVSSKLSIVPKAIKADGLADANLLTADLYIIAGGDNTGSLYISSEEPVDTDDVKYLELNSSKYHLRVDGASQEVYLEIIAG